MVIVRVPLSDIIHSGSLSLTLYNSFIVCSVHQEVVEVVGLKILCARRPVKKSVMKFLSGKAGMKPIKSVYTTQIR